jgi:flagellar assembly protein FliH
VDTFELPALDSDGLIYGSRAAEAALEAERNAVLAEARERGHADGFAAGQQEGREQLEPAIRAVMEAITGIGHARDEVSAAVEDAAVELALKIAEQVLAGQLEADPAVVVGIVRGALRRLVDRERVTVLVNPDDLDMMREMIPGLVAELGGIEHCEVQAERRVGRGGAVVRTVEGEIDATIQTKLEQVRETLARAGQQDA